MKYPTCIYVYSKWMWERKAESGAGTSISFSSKIESRFCGTSSLKPCRKAFIWGSIRDTNRHSITRLQAYVNIKNINDL